MELSRNDTSSHEGSHRRRSGSRPPKVYRILEGFSEGIIYFMVIFSPWLFGTTDPWAVRIMNGAAYGLGGFLAAKWWYRSKTGYKPPRWDDVEGEVDKRARVRNALTRALGWLTVAILAYVLISGLNARANFYVNEQRFEYYDCFYWLPHSYDKGATMFLFWMYLGLGIFFWATRDWILGKTATEITGRTGFIVPVRMRRLLWVMCINGGVLAIEALLQRLSGTNKVLGLVQPRLNNASEGQYGPYPYRSNAAQYFNILWPVCLGFWWMLQAEKKRNPSRARVGTGPDLLILPVIILMAASPIISTSRGGSIVAILEIILASAILLSAGRRNRQNQLVTALIFAAVIALAGFFGWRNLAVRLQQMTIDNMNGRSKIYANAQQMRQDFGLFGSGPGSFAALYQLYRSQESDEWAAYLHDDWVETQITFGWFGCLILASTIIIPLWKALMADHRTESEPMVTLAFVSLAGCFLHAKCDFPFQVYSVLLLTILCVVALECSQAAFGDGRSG